MTTEALWPIKAKQKTARTFTVLDDATPPAAVDITGWTVDAAIKARPGGNVLYAFPSGAWTIVSGPLGQVRLTLPASVSAGFRFGHAWYRVRVFLPASADDAQRILEGPMTVSPD
jgi:hypothetical protein